MIKGRGRKEEKKKNENRDKNIIFQELLSWQRTRLVKGALSFYRAGLFITPSLSCEENKAKQKKKELLTCRAIIVVPDNTWKKKENKM